MAISHDGHDHPATPAGRAACRKAMAAGNAPAATGKPAKMTVVPRTKGDGGVVKGLKASASTRNLKKPGTRLKDIGDLPDVPRMLAHGARLAWAEGWEVKVGEQFNDLEARIVCAGPTAELALVWKPSLPHGVWGVFVRPWDSSITHRVNDIQSGVDMAAGRMPIG